MANEKVIGRCPLCGNDIVERSKSWSCTGYNKDDPNSCHFSIWKMTSGTNIEEDTARQILQTGESDELEFTSRAGKLFKSKLIIGATMNRVCFSFQDEKMEIKADEPAVDTEVDYEEFVPEDASGSSEYDDLPF